MIERLEAEVDALRVGAGFVVEELARAVADGLAAGVPPAPGLIDVAEILGVAIEPRRWTVAEMIAPFEVAARSAKAIVGAVETSGIWVDTYAMVETWFENSSESRAIVDANADDEEAALGALRGYLAGRGDWWGRLFAVAARALGAAGHPAARDFASVADLVAAGTPLDRLPIGREIVERTLDARLDALDAIEADRTEDEDEEEEEDGWRGPDAGDAEALDAALAARGLGVAWVDGFMTAAIVAPTVPAFAHLMASAAAAAGTGHDRRHAGPPRRADDAGERDRRGLARPGDLRGADGGGPGRGAGGLGARLHRVGAARGRGVAGHVGEESRQRDAVAHRRRRARRGRGRPLARPRALADRAAAALSRRGQSRASSAASSARRP